MEKSHGLTNQKLSARGTFFYVIPLADFIIIRYGKATAKD